MKFNSLQAVIDWNLRVGNNPKIFGTEAYWTSLKNQAKCLLEEVNELVEAIEQKDSVEVLDAQADIQYVLDGFIFLSQHNHEGAMEEVCKNNDLKYTTNNHKIIERLESLDTDTHYIRTTEIDGVAYHTIICSEDGKVIKGKDHPQVNLKPFLKQTYKVFEVVVKENCSLCDTVVQDLQILGEKTIIESYNVLLAVGEVYLIVKDKSGKVIHQDIVNYKDLGYSINQLEHWIKGVEGKAKQILLRGN